MHDEPGGETGEGFDELDPVLVHSLDFHLFRPPDRSVKPGDREAALESRSVSRTAESEILALVENDWIEVNFDFFVQVSDEAAQVVADLGEREADSFWVVGANHRVD